MLFFSPATVLFLPQMNDSVSHLPPRDAETSRFGGAPPLLELGRSEPLEPPLRELGDADDLSLPDLLDGLLDGLRLSCIGSDARAMRAVLG